MKVLAIYGSPRKEGNTARMLDAALSAFPETAEIILFGSPSQFSDVSVNIKKLMERTWWMKGQLKNKIGGYVVSGRRYMESTLNTLHAFMLRHRMILGGSGALGFTFTEMGNLDNDPLALRDAKNTGKRLVELHSMIYKNK